MLWKPSRAAEDAVEEHQEPQHRAGIARSKHHGNFTGRDDRETVTKIAWSAETQNLLLSQMRAFLRDWVDGSRAPGINMSNTPRKVETISVEDQALVPGSRLMVQIHSSESRPRKPRDHRCPGRLRSPRAGRFPFSIIFQLKAFRKSHKCR